MKNCFSIFLTAAIFAASMVGCKSSKNIESSTQKEIANTILIKQTSSNIEDNIITAKYDNGTTLYYRILDNFGNVSVTWDRTNGRKSFDDGVSSYKGKIDIPSFVYTGDNGEFVFRVMEIDENAFYGCDRITSVSVPFSIVRILPNAFKGCTGIEKYNVNQDNQTYRDIDGVLFSRDSTMLIDYPSKKNAAEYLVPQTVSYICTSAFMGNTFLKKVSIGNFCTAISDFAFMGCTALKEVELGNHVRIIGAQAFKNCSSLEIINARGIFPAHNSPTVFDDATKQNCKLYVPKGQMQNYKRRLEWGDFKNMQEY
ncbi:MAG: leucine-rich repeat domain-containing protein [Bacteroidaceae bacterium]|nr:leucine-rich repeat domain-containing protein [Bacteroidaceae bacterium]